MNNARWHENGIEDTNGSHSRHIRPAVLNLGFPRFVKRSPGVITIINSARSRQCWNDYKISRVIWSPLSLFNEVSHLLYECRLRKFFGVALHISQEALGGWRTLLL